MLKQKLTAFHRTDRFGKCYGWIVTSMSSCRYGWLRICSLTALLCAGFWSPLLAQQSERAAVAAPSPAVEALVLDHVVMLVRHGVRAPLPDEFTTGLATQPWPIWSTPGSLLTPHGREGMRLLGIYDRARFSAAGLLTGGGCPSQGVIFIWANAVQRTIASGEAFADGMAPGCGVAVHHLALGTQDPLFAWPGPNLPDFEATKAVAAINAETGGAAKLAAPYRDAIGTLETILGCDRQAKAASACGVAAAPAQIKVSSDGQGIDLSGAIRITSGLASVFMLQYLEGFPLDEVGWGRATPARLAKVSRLHALLFSVYSRPAYIAPRVAQALGRRLLAQVQGCAGDKRSPAKIAIFVGHDDNIAAITALLDVDFQSPGYGKDDPPLGGALIFEVFRDPTTGERYVRTLLQAQTPDQLRTLASLSLAQPPQIQTLAIPGCADRRTSLCRLDDFATLLRGRLTLSRPRER